MVVMMEEALRKRRSYGQPYTRAPTLKHVHFVKKMGIDLWLLQILAQFLTNFLYLRFVSTLQDRLVPAHIGNIYLHFK